LARSDQIAATETITQCLVLGSLIYGVGFVLVILETTQQFHGDGGVIFTLGFALIIFGVMLAGVGVIAKGFLLALRASVPGGSAGGFHDGGVHE
jgi:hypothetical protein